MNANEFKIELVMNAISIKLANEFNAYGCTAPFLAVVNDVDASMDIKFVDGCERFFANGQQGQMDLRQFCQDTLSGPDDNVLGVLLAHEAWVTKMQNGHKPAKEEAIIVILAMRDGANFSRVLPVDFDTNRIEYRPCSFQHDLSQSIVDQFTGGRLRNDSAAVSLNSQELQNDDPDFLLSDVHPEPPGLH